MTAPSAAPPSALPAEGDFRARLPRLFRSRWFRHYARSKLKTDPLYDAVYPVLLSADRPLLDVGCGLGLFAFFLRERGFERPIFGLDYDFRKIREANWIAANHYADIAFAAGDARDIRAAAPGFRGSVTLLDMLQFFQAGERAELLRGAAEATGPGGVLVIRNGVRDASWRFRATRWGDVFAKATFWMKELPVDYPSADEIRCALEGAGLKAREIRPLWGGTPFNNYLFVFEREEEAGGGDTSDAPRTS